MDTPKTPPASPERNINPPSIKMDHYNAKALRVLEGEGNDSFIKHVFTDQDTGAPMSYAEMRMRYG
jgi:hypothetical protein